LRSADADVEKYLKLLTFLPLPEISKVTQEHEQDQSKRVAQHKLAAEFVELIHGLEAARDAETQHRQLHNKNLSISDIKASVKETKVSEPHPKTGVPMFEHPSLNKHAQPLHREDNISTTIKLPQSLVVGKIASRILWSAGLVSSKVEGTRLINAGGAYIGGATDAENLMGDSLSFTPLKSNKWSEVEKRIVDGNLLILRSGKWRIKVINIIPDDEFAQLGLTCPGWNEHLQEQSQSTSNSSGTGIREKNGEVVATPSTML
jgi:tyrosyl-tRNA synthetase